MAQKAIPVDHRHIIAHNTTKHMANTPYSNLTMDDLSLSYYADNTVKDGSQTYLYVQLTHVQEVHLVSAPQDESVGTNTFVAHWVYNLTGVVQVNEEPLDLDAFEEDQKHEYGDLNSDGKDVKVDLFNATMKVTVLNETSFRILGSVVDVSLENAVVLMFNETRLLATLRADQEPASENKGEAKEGESDHSPGEKSDESEKQRTFTHPVATLLGMVVILAAGFYFFNKQRQGLINRGLMARMRGNKDFRRTAGDYDMVRSDDEEEGMEMFRISSDREDDDRQEHML
ncbi:hypothetical protein BABINDRAFT_161520 [Babjeviella inositovora NRRL Y-12698]|uniref:Uncharacterized protein n=1 Tax=Babjeviella inositovora NRRL Y-12698 TaxID=984486 RepID=A0A1E3QQQ4_9ASCO|nr:uncharacterized protein BABINDRAFT_161520 [Babjeviella inositovora NRRL Y-12698]ODQ79834.1 hypothetical protein BABINDRAFT_161520 [Babjeviella inositovora NRRL Y-12698]